MTRSVKHLVIGGGAVGLSIAYHLTELGETDVLVLERNEIASGASWHAAGIVGPLRATLNMTRLAMYVGELLPRLEAETGLSTGYRQTGGYWLAQTEDRLEELRRIAGMGERVGLDATIIAPLELAEAAPYINTNDLVGALRVAEDARLDPVGLCQTYAKAARRGGAMIETGVCVARIETERGRVTGARLSNGERLLADKIVLCAGAWTRHLAATAGASVALQAVEHMYVVTEKMASLPDPTPVFRDLDSGVYLLGGAGSLLLGGFEPNAKLWNARGPEGDRAFLELPEDWEQFGPFMEAGLHRAPALAELGVQRFMNGPESFTPDTKPLLGETPEITNLFVAAGFNSVGVMSSAGVGRVMADWVRNRAAAMDLWEVDIARLPVEADAPAYLRARMREAVAAQFDMHWPYKQMKHGRGARRSALHQNWAAAGAVFGALAGWERPLWYGEPSSLDYSYGAQNWWAAAGEEARAMARGAALMELTPFTKIDVAGPDALDLLQRCCAGDVDIAAGRTIYTPMLNARGGIEADVTVTRWSETDFRVTSGAATRRKDLAWLRRAADGANVNIHDTTSAEIVIGVMGPGAVDLLAPLTSVDLSVDAFRFGAARRIDLGMAKATATRLSFVGESGFEIAAPVEFAAHVYETLADTAPAHLGHFALDGCRLEKGFKHWGHDLGPDLTPIEAGVGFTIGWAKPDFTGRDALLRQRDIGAGRWLLLFEVEPISDTPPLLLHDEPIRRDGEIVGLTTSGGLGPRTGLALALGVVSASSRAEASAADYEIQIGGRLHPARALTRAPYDPDGRRLKGGA